MPNRNPSPQRPAGPRRFVHWLLRDRRTGRVTIAQWPNPALLVWVVTTIVAGLDLSAPRADELHWIGSGALIAWGADEIARGANPARRLLGLVVLGWQVHRLLS